MWAGLRPYMSLPTSWCHGGKTEVGRERKDSGSLGSDFGGDEVGLSSRTPWFPGRNGRRGNGGGMKPRPTLFRRIQGPKEADRTYSSVSLGPDGDLMVMITTSSPNRFLIENWDFEWVLSKGITRGSIPYLKFENCQPSWSSKMVEGHPGAFSPQKLPWRHKWDNESHWSVKLSKLTRKEY